jgi:hypothetical protein
MAVFPGPVVDHVQQSHQGQAALEAHMLVQNKAMDMQASASAALLIAAAGYLPLVCSGQVGAQVKALA